MSKVFYSFVVAMMASFLLACGDSQGYAGNGDSGMVSDSAMQDAGTMVDSGPVEVCETHLFTWQVEPWISQNLPSRTESFHGVSFIEDGFLVSNFLMKSDRPISISAIEFFVITPQPGEMPTWYDAQDRTNEYFIDQQSSFMYFYPNIKYNFVANYNQPNSIDASIPLPWFSHNTEHEDNDIFIFASFHFQIELSYCLK